MHTALTGYIKPKKSEEKMENSNNPPPQWYRYNQCDNMSINRWENFLTVTNLTSFLEGGNRDVTVMNPVHGLLLTHHQRSLAHSLTH